MTKITWFAQQVKQRKVLYDHHVPISFNDPRWSDQVWYLVSTSTTLNTGIQIIHSLRHKLKPEINEV